jgi:putative colanic acid biosynthesis acetyltransferase WcaF
MRLDLFCNTNFERGASRLKEAFWLLVSGLFVESWLPGSGWRVALLRLFGARIGEGVVIKPGVKVKFPWRLAVDKNSWIGERVWIDNLGQVTIGKHACLSQGAYLCTGSHDWTSESFDLIVAPISIADHAWICAYTTLAPGSSIGEGAVVTMGRTTVGQVQAWTVWTQEHKRPRIISRE